MKTYTQAHRAQQRARNAQARAILDSLPIAAPAFTGVAEVIMKTYQVTVFKSESLIYSIEASSESEARAKMGEGTEKLLKSCLHDFDITYIDEVA